MLNYKDFILDPWRVSIVGLSLAIFIALATFHETKSLPLAAMIFVLAFFVLAGSAYAFGNVRAKTAHMDTFIADEKSLRGRGIRDLKVLSFWIAPPPTTINWLDISRIEIQHETNWRGYAPIERKLLATLHSGQEQRLLIPRVNPQEWERVISAIQNIARSHKFALELE